MSIFGWSYPPGCSGPPEEHEPHPKSEEAWEMMEAAGVDESVIDKVCSLIDELAIKAEQECPQCLAAYAKQEEIELSKFSEQCLNPTNTKAERS